MSVQTVVTLAAGELTPRVAVTNGEFVLFGLRTSPGRNLKQPAWQWDLTILTCLTGKILQFQIQSFQQAGLDDFPRISRDSV